MKVCVVGASGKLGLHGAARARSRPRGRRRVPRGKRRQARRVQGRMTIVPGATDDTEVIKRAVAGCDGVLVVLVPRGVHGYSTGTAQAVLTTPLQERASCSPVAGTSPSTAKTS